MNARRFLTALAFALLLATALGGCSGRAVEARADVVSADGAALAHTQDPRDGNGERVYPLGSAASPLVGSLYANAAPDGVEQLFADDLRSGREVQLTIDSGMQEAAFDALGSHAGAVVALDSETGAVLALASAPAYDPASAAGDADLLANHALELHVPGSTFKTVTLAAALESGTATVDSVYPAPNRLDFDDGSIANSLTPPDSQMTLEEAFADSVNTVFAQLALEVGPEAISEQAAQLGLGRDIAADFPLPASKIYGESSMSARMQAWSGVGQALYQADGELQGPMMTPVQGAVIAAAVENGGSRISPYLVARIGDEPTVAAMGGIAPEEAFSERTARDIARCMRDAVREGTGVSAGVAGVDVGGKTGTAEAMGGEDAWFIGFAERDGKKCALAVVVEDAASTEASAVAARFIQAVFSEARQ